MTAPERSRPPEPRPRRLLAAALAMAALGALAFTLVLPATLPSDAHYAEVAALLSEQGRPGDAILLAPRWAERLRLFLPGDPPLLALPADDPDLARFRRLWLVALPYVPRSDAAASAQRLAARFGPPALRTDVGPLALARFDLPPGPAPFRFEARVEEAQVFLGERPCPWRPSHRGGPRFQCPRGPWNYVAAQVREVDYLPRECIWAHPADGAPLRILFPDVPLGEALHVRAGLVGEVALDPQLAPVHLTVEVAGRRIGTVDIPPAPGFPEHRLPLGEAGLRGEVLFEITTPKAARRLMCFQAWTEAGDD